LGKWQTNYIFGNAWKQELVGTLANVYLKINRVLFKMGIDFSGAYFVLAIIIIDREGAAGVWWLRFEHSLQKLTHLRIVGTFDQVGENVEELVERLVPWKCAEDDKGGLRAGAMSDVAKRPLAVNVSENKVKVLHAPPEKTTTE
jgi:hypothetical protein